MTVPAVPTAPAADEPAGRRVWHALHATILVASCDGPERRVLVTVCWPGTAEPVPDLRWSDPDVAAAVGRAAFLAVVFDSTTIGGYCTAAGLL